MVYYIVLQQTDFVNTKSHFGESKRLSDEAKHKQIRIN